MCHSGVYIERTLSAYDKHILCIHMPSNTHFIHYEYYTIHIPILTPCVYYTYACSTYTLIIYLTLILPHIPIPTYPIPDTRINIDVRGAQKVGHVHFNSQFQRL